MQCSVNKRWGFTSLREDQHLQALRKFRFFFFLPHPFSSDFRSLHDCNTTAGKHVWKVIGSDRWTYFEIKLSLWYYWKEVTKSKIKPDRMLLSCLCSFFFLCQGSTQSGRLKQGHCLFSEFPHLGQFVLNLQTCLLHVTWSLQNFKPPSMYHRTFECVFHRYH